MGTHAAVARPKFKGYAALSRYQDTDIDLGLIRRFGHLHFRNLLYYQDELAELEEHLERIDLHQDLQDKEHGSRRRDKNPARVGLMGQIRSKLQAFGKTNETLSVRKTQLRVRRRGNAFDCRDPASTKVTTQADSSTGDLHEADSTSGEGGRNVHYEVA